MIQASLIISNEFQYSSTLSETCRMSFLNIFSVHDVMVLVDPSFCPCW